MKSLYQIVNIFFLFLYLLPLSSFGASISQISTKEYLVAFSPEVFLETGESCQGVRVSDGYIATSEECRKKIKQQLANDDIQVVDDYNIPIGEISESIRDSVDDNFQMKVPIFYDETRVNPEYLEVHDFNSDTSYVYSYSMNDNGSLIQVPAHLISSNPSDSQEIYFISNPGNHLSGKVFFDAENNIVCISSANGQCNPLPKKHRLKKRSEDDFVRDDENDSGSGISTTTYIIIGAALVGVGVLSNLACLSAINIRACAKGMPLKVLWSALLSCGYCKSPHTDYCLLCGWPGVAWSWIGAYQPATEDRLPVFSNME